MRWVLLLWLAGCGAPVVAAGDCAPNGFDAHPRSARYTELLAEYCRASRSPGCIVMVDRPGEPLWAGSRGFADLSSGAPMCVDTPMRVGSVSKTYVAALVMKLVEEGALRLDTTLAEALPEVVGRIPKTDRITVLQLLAHRSGVLNPETQDLFAQTDYFDRPDQLIPLTLEERFEHYVYDRPLLFEPGTSRRYSNPGYDLLGRIVARSEGTSLQQALERIVLSPLGHTQTSFVDRDRLGIARGYVDTAEGRLIDVTENDKANVNELSPSGGLVGTAAEVRGFFRALASDELLTGASRQTLESGEGELRQGLIAVLHDGEPIAFGHQGALIGESTWALYFPAEDAVVVLMVNSDGSADDVAFARRFLE